ncbi:MAG: HAD family phosphatase [Pseudotabrizicola sp.]|uniref:HAD family hydrolase n=1 Tax=Pseudotabrizicola sp. TaxID=2939647 RepID=UPI0027250003|nr:HAD family phosphatase [Pseudotabrizicola sp.]MDO8881423.1 HAD family phosphatase [Pseudotabrizicola sp.]MDP2082236.1 HAD family phosphatase [Pseudotabrizicola sp.]MDZ7575156.1 HAD family phosphatase [Pseudotabrizicola sp.]
MFDAVFFDLDGTLVDSERLTVQTGAAAFAAQGHHDVEDLLHSIVGIDQITSAGMILARFPGLDIHSLNETWETAFLAAQAVDLLLKPGASEIVHGLRDRHALALVTSSRRDPAEARLVQAGLRPAFHAVITRDDVSAPKPHPEPYLLAASRLGVDPARCLVFEDSEPGAEAAFSAGMTVVQVPDMIPASGRFAHHVATSLTDGARWAGIWG